QRQKLFDVSRPLHIQLAELLGYAYQSGATFSVGDAAVSVLSEIEQNGSPYLVVLSGRFLSEAESVLDVAVDRHLPQKALDAGQQQAPDGTTLGDVIAGIFAEEQPRRSVLLLSGQEVIPGERARWGRGHYLRFDLGELLSRKDSAALSI